MYGNLAGNRVSIPHRQSKNDGNIFNLVGIAKEFQFLIGSLRTEEGDLVLAKLPGFNSS